MYFFFIFCYKKCFLFPKALMCNPSQTDRSISAHPNAYPQRVGIQRYRKYGNVLMESNFNSLMAVGTFFPHGRPFNSITSLMVLSLKKTFLQLPPEPITEKATKKFRYVAAATDKSLGRFGIEMFLAARQFEFVMISNE